MKQTTQIISCDVCSRAGASKNIGIFNRFKTIVDYIKVPSHPIYKVYGMPNNIVYGRVKKFYICKDCLNKIGRTINNTKGE